MPETRVPLNDLKRYAGESASRTEAAAAAVIRNGHYILGPAVSSFERAFADYCGTRHCVGVANGTDALELALRALDIAHGDVVLVAANAAMYGTGAVLAVGAMPAFVDVDADSAVITGDTLLRAIETSEVPPRAVIVTHLYGRLAPMQEILPLCRDRDILVIEDCAQAHGATGADGKKAGSYGEVACFSFYPTKNLGAIGDAGAVACDSDALATRLRQFRQYGWSQKYRNDLRGGRNSRLDELQAAFLLALLPDLDRRNARRRGIAQRYSREIVNTHITVPVAGGADYVAHLYVVRSRQRDALARYLAASGIVTDVHYPLPDYRQPILAQSSAGISLPVTEALCAEVLTLPCFPELRDDECDAVVAACNGWEPA